MKAHDSDEIRALRNIVLRDRPDDLPSQLTNRLNLCQTVEGRLAKVSRLFLTIGKQSINKLGQFKFPQLLHANHCVAESLDEGWNI